MAERPVCLLIGALGGQGGGVLADWLVDAANEAGYPAQATSIPGVAQRTGATTYYFELYPEHSPAQTPVFSLFPAADDVDLMAAMEPTEAGRALEKGWITARTQVITTVQRIYSTAEKSLAGDGRVDPLPIIDALTRAARSLVLLEPESGTQANALMFGAIAGSGVLPIAPDDLRAAIERKGLAVAANLKAFDAGLQMAAAPPPAAATSEPLHYAKPPASFETEIRRLPSALHAIAGHGVARLVDYQSRDYAGLYLNRLRSIVELDSSDRGHRLSLEVGKRLGAWMSFEDIMRVAQLKTRPGRLARIRDEIGAHADDPILVYDYFKPRLHEIGAILPRAMGGWMRGGGDERPATGLRLRWPTATPLGYALLKLLAWLRRWRVKGAGYQDEQDGIEAWLQAVREALAVDYDLALATAELAVWARGYGEVRDRGLRHLEGIWVHWSSRLALDPVSLRASVDASLQAARTNPEQPPPVS